MVTRSAGRMRVGAWLVAALAAWFVACSDGSTGPGPGPTPPAPNRPPLAMGTIPAQEIPLADTVRVDIAPYFTDPDGDALSYAVRSSAPQVVDASSSGSSVALAGLARGSATITVTASDPSGLEASHAFEATVPNSGPAPAGALLPVEVPLGEEVEIDVSSSFTDPDGDALVYAAASSDPAVAEAEAEGALVTVRATGRGVAAVTVTATDPSGLDAAQRFEVTVPNSGPRATGTLSDLELVLGEEAEVEVSTAFSDPDGDALAWRAASSDTTVVAAQAAEGIVTVRARARGVAVVTITASDPDGLDASLAFEVTVPNSGPEPRGAPPPVELSLGDSATVEVSPHFTDPDGDALTFRPSSSDPAVVAARSRGNAVTLEALARGTATITVTAADPDGLEASLAFEVTVPNSPPRIVEPVPDRELALGEEATVEAASHFTDPDGDALTFRASSSHPATVAARSRGNVVTLEALARGMATVTVTAADPDGLEASLAFDVTVPNSPPGITAPALDLELALGAEATVEAAYHFTDPDGDTLTFRASSSDSTVVAARSRGNVVTLDARARGTATITVTAADPGGLEATLAFEVTVPNSPPGTTAPLPDVELALDEEATVEAASHFADPDGDALTFRASSSDATVVAARSSGNAVTLHARRGGTAAITVTAADPDGAEASLAFEVTVPNSPPRGTAPLPDLELAAGTETTLDASSHFTDPDGEALTFRASSSDTAVVAARSGGNVVTLEPRARGTATITVTAADPHGLEVSRSFEVTVPNSGPEATAPIPDLDVSVGDGLELHMSLVFTDRDGDALEHTAVSSNPAVVSAAVSGSVLRLTAASLGSATIEVTAADPAGLEASQSFRVAVTNLPPTATATPPDLTLAVGDETLLLLSPYFSDPEGEPLTFSGTSSNEALVSVTSTADTIRIRGVAGGAARVTVAAADPRGAAAEQSFQVSVRRPGYDIEIAWHDALTESQRAVIAAAANTWADVLAVSELSDVRFDERVSCGFLTTTREVEVVDELLLMVATVYVDGPGGVLGYAGPCYLRRSNGLPIVGHVVLDSEDIDRIPPAGLFNLALHEIAHVLGLGILWDLVNPSAGTPDSETVDTHFPGPNAVAGFNAAGGASYTGGKVPVENEISGRDGHWRYSMFAGELMAPRIRADGSSALSAITILALADLGYGVDLSLADPYAVALPDLPGEPRIEADVGGTIHLGDDIARVPIRVVDDEGRVMETIVPRERPSPLLSLPDRPVRLTRPRD